MKRKRFGNICLSLLATASILTMGINNALAYFTTYTSAEGGIPIHLGEERTEITETFDSRTKHVTITNDAGSGPVYIRARAFCARYELTYKSVPEGTWTQENGSWNRIVPEGESGEYWYYKDIVEGGGSTTTLDVVIDIPSLSEGTNGEGTKPEDGESFNVIVIYESTPVRYDENGEPYADWSGILDTVTDTGRMEGNTGNGTGGDGNVGE